MTMECRDIRESISACVDGEASPGEAASVREHLASCERCRVLERQMRAVGAGVRQVRGSVPDRFREEVFARLESEGALPKRKKVVSAAWRWVAVPLAAAAGLGLFLLTSREVVRGPAPPGPAVARVGTSAPHVPSPQGNGSALSAEDREMLAMLDLLEDPVAFETNDDAVGVDLLAPGDSADSPDPPRGGRSGA
jgi:anti-sigma factor RsiW